MKKWMICFAALLSFVLAAPAAFAVDFSRRADLFVSSVRWYDGDAAAGTRITAMKTGSCYDRLTAVVNVEAATDGAPADVTAAAIIEGAPGEQQGRVIETKRISGGARFELTLDGVTAESETTAARVLVWSGLNTLMPQAAAQELVTQAEPETQQAADMRTIRERIAADCALYSTSANPQTLINKLGPDGKFTDIDYTSRAQTAWPVSAALANASNLLKAYYSEGNRWYGDDTLKAAIDSVLSDWAANKYESTNWWYQEIDVPNKLSQILMYPLPEADYMDTLRALARKGLPKTNDSLPHLASDTGANLTDKLLTAAKIAASTGDADSMETIVSRLLDNELSVFDHASGGEGIMIDGSIHQHGSLFYNGSYGGVFCSDINKLLGYLADTEFMVSGRALNTYADFILDGQSYLFRGNGSDYACFGRSIARANGVGGSVRANCLGAANVLLTVPGVERRAELAALKNTRLALADNGAVLAKHFWTSDFTVLQREGFYTSVRNSSSRNKNTEYMNNENSKGYYIADGATVIMQTGQEYLGIFPVWDWSRIPGTTTAYLPFDSIPSPAAEYGKTTFVGGVSDGLYAVTAMDYSHNGVTAKKANFLFDSGFTALGAGITGTDGSKKVTTTLNQCVSNSAPQAAADNSWVMHDGIGYYLPQPADVVMDNAAKTGSWRSINESQSADAVTKNVFTLWIDHGTAPSGASYEYAVLPGESADGMRAYAENPDMVTVSNTAKCQAVWSKEAGAAGIVFWNQGVSNYSESVTLPAAATGLDHDVTVTAAKDPCAVLLRRAGDSWAVSVSNPKNDSLARTELVVDGKVVTVELPQGMERGKSVTVIIPE